jgi:hypothetical protein
MKYVTLVLATAVTSLLLATPVEAHELTKKKAKDALKPVAAEMAKTVGPLVAPKLPGATIAKTSVEDCTIKKSHRAECALTFAIQGVQTGETYCVTQGFVKFKNARSRELRVGADPGVICFFQVPLP